MPPFIFNPEFANRILAVITDTPKTAREIADELGCERHIVNQHLYKIQGLEKSRDRVPVWMLPQQPPPQAAGMTVVIQDRNGALRGIPAEEFLAHADEYEDDPEELPWGDGTTRWGYKMKPLALADEPAALGDLD